MKLTPTSGSYLSAARTRPAFASLTRSPRGTPRFWYCLATEKANRRLARINSDRALSRTSSVVAPLIVRARSFCCCAVRTGSPRSSAMYRSSRSRSSFVVYIVHLGAQRAPDLMFMQLYNHLIAGFAFSSRRVLRALDRRLPPARRHCRLCRRNGHSAPQLRHVGIKHRRSRPVVHELSIPSRLHEACACQLLQMMRDRCLPDREAAAQSAAPDFGLLGDVL